MYKNDRWTGALGDGVESHRTTVYGAAAGGRTQRFPFKLLARRADNPAWDAIDLRFSNWLDEATVRGWRNSGAPFRRRSCAI
jgi:hypothetical protein